MFQWLLNLFGGESPQYSASSLIKHIGSECCENEDCSGDVDAQKLAKVCQRLRGQGLVKSLARSKISDLSELFKIFENIRWQLSFNKKGCPQNLDQVIQVVAHATHDALSMRGASAGDLYLLVSRACFEHDDFSGHVSTSCVDKLFESLDSNVFRAKFLEATTNEICKADFALSRVISEGSAAASRSIKSIRNLLAEVASPIFAKSINGLNQVQEASQLADVLASNCCEYDDGSGNIYPQMDTLLSQMDMSKAKKVISQSNPESVHDLYKLLMKIKEQFKMMSEPAKQLQAACIQAINVHFHEVSSVELLNKVITSVCFEDEYSTAKVCVEQSRALLANLNVTKMVDLLATSNMRSIWRLTFLLERAVKAAGLTSDSSLSALLVLLNQYSRVKCQSLRQTLQHNTNLSSIRSIVSEACEYDDCSGKLHVPTLQLILLGYSPPNQFQRIGEGYESLTRSIERLQDSLRKQGQYCEGLVALDLAIQGEISPRRKARVGLSESAMAIDEGRQFAGLFSNLNPKGVANYAEYLTKASSTESQELSRWLETARPMEIAKVAKFFNEAIGTEIFRVINFIRTPELLSGKATQSKPSPTSESLESSSEDHSLQVVLPEVDEGLIRFECPGCKHRLKANSCNVGKWATCRKCKNKVQVPEPTLHSRHTVDNRDEIRESDATSEGWSAIERLAEATGSVRLAQNPGIANTSLLQFAVLVFRVSATPPPDCKEYCNHVAVLKYGRAPDLMESWYCVGVRSEIILDYSYALGLYGRLRQKDQLPDLGELMDYYVGFGPDSQQIIALLFSSR